MVNRFLISGQQVSSPTPRDIKCKNSQEKTLGILPGFGELNSDRKGEKVCDGNSKCWLCEHCVTTLKTRLHIVHVIFKCAGHVLKNTLQINPPQEGIDKMQ